MSALPAVTRPGEVPATRRQPLPGRRASTMQAGSALHNDVDLDRQKRTLLHGIARDVVDAPTDVLQDDVDQERERLDAARLVQREAEANLSRTLGPWVKEMFCPRSGNDRILSSYRAERWTRANKLNNQPVIEITVQWRESPDSSPSRPANPIEYGYRLRGYEGVSGTGFEHADLSVVMAVADLAARLHGCRMVDSTETQILPPAPPVLALSVVAPARPSTGRALLLEDRDHAVQAVTVQPDPIPVASSVSDVLAALEGMY